MVDVLCVENAGIQGGLQVSPATIPKIVVILFGNSSNSFLAFFTPTTLPLSSLSM